LSIPISNEDKKKNLQQDITKIERRKEEKEEKNEINWQNFIELLESQW